VTDRPRLLAAADQLPRTADGVLAVPNTGVIYYNRHPDGCIRVWAYTADLRDARSHRNADNEVEWVEITDCFSTPEAVDVAFFADNAARERGSE